MSLTEDDRIKLVAKELNKFTVHDLHDEMLIRWPSTSPIRTLAAKLIKFKRIKKIGYEKIHYLNGTSDVILYKWGNMNDE